MAIPKPKEALTLYKEGFALMKREAGAHIDKEYEIVSDKTEEGTRTLVLKEKDTAEMQKRVRVLVDVIMKGLGETSKTLEKLLYDTLIDYWDESIERIYNKIVLKKEPVKARAGCFAIIIGDGRKKNAERIDLREGQ